MEMSLDCGDSLLLCGLLAKGSAKLFGRGWLLHQHVVRVWFEVEQAGLRVVVPK